MAVNLRVTIGLRPPPTAPHPGPTPQDRTKTAPRRPQNLQDRPKDAPARPQDRPEPTQERRKNTECARRSPGETNLEPPPRGNRSPCSLFCALAFSTEHATQNFEAASTRPRRCDKRVVFEHLRNQARVIRWHCMHGSQRKETRRHGPCFTLAHDALSVR